MSLDGIDLTAFQKQLHDAFRVVSVHIEDGTPFPSVSLKIDGAPEEITVLFEQNAVIQAGHFTTEAPYGRTSYAPVVRALVLMAQNGYHAHRGLTGTTSRLGPPRSPRSAVTSAAPWTDALKA